MAEESRQNGGGVLIIGAGIAGVTVADRLSRSGRQVYLIEKQPTIGGHVLEMGCKATDVCLRCNVCVAHELFRTVGNDPNISIYTQTELARLEKGENGHRYKAILRHRPAFIDRGRCTGCRACVEACPEDCISMPKVALTPAVPVIDYPACRRAMGKECSTCEEICPFGAINLAGEVTESQIDIQNVVLATGYKPYDPAENASFGYGKSANIITGIEAERQLAEHQKITRPSDGQVPGRIAFIQCIGSRTEEAHSRPEDTDYCSTVCCSYALRMALLMKHLNAESEISIFYMDIQNFGKGFNSFYQKCEANMSFIRSRPYEIRPGPEDTLLVKFTPQSPQEGLSSQVLEQEFDLVVLSVGMRPAQEATKLAEKLLLPVDEYGFYGFKDAAPLPALQHKGIFVAGACASPKDIEGTISQAEAVSAAIVSKWSQA